MLARGLAPVRGSSLTDAVDLAIELRAQGLRVDIERTPPNPLSSPEDPAWREYRAVALPEACAALTALERAGFAQAGGVTIAADPVGALVPTFAEWPSGTTSGRAALRVVAEQAQEARIPLTLADGADSTVPALLDLAREFQVDGLSVALTLAAARRRSAADCATYEGPIRLVKGGRGAAERSSAERFRVPLEVDKSFIRCVKARLTAGLAVSVATHDGRLIQIIRAVAHRLRCAPGSVEYVLTVGRNARLQRQLVQEGEAVRVIVPYGSPGLDGLDGMVTAVRAALARPASLVSAWGKER